VVCSAACVRPFFVGHMEALRMVLERTGRWTWEVNVWALAEALGTWGGGAPSLRIASASRPRSEPPLAKAEDAARAARDHEEGGDSPVLWVRADHNASMLRQVSLLCRMLAASLSSP